MLYDHLNRNVPLVAAVTTALSQIHIHPHVLLIWKYANIAMFVAGLVAI